MKRPFDAVYGRCPVKLTPPLRIPFEVPLAFAGGVVAMWCYTQQYWLASGIWAFAALTSTVGAYFGIRRSFYEGARAILYMLRDGKL